MFLWQLQELLRPRGRVVKAFVYIFDVGENMGATSVVPGARSAIARQPFAQNTPLAGTGETAGPSSPDSGTSLAGSHRLPGGPHLLTRQFGNGENAAEGTELP